MKKSQKIIAVLMVAVTLFCIVPDKRSSAATVVAGGIAIGELLKTAAVVTGIVVAVRAATEHTKNKRKSTHDKHAKNRPGRETTKNRQKPGFRKKFNRR